MSADWDAVYRTTFADLVRYLCRKIGDVDRAQDLAQEAFVRALDHRPGNPRAWLFKVASNLARDEVRSVVRRKRHLTLIKSETKPASAAPTIAEIIEAETRARAAQQALAQLSERDQETLLLWDAGLSYAEIAAQTGLAVGAVGTTLTRARRRLVEACHAAMKGNHVTRMKECCTRTWTVRFIRETSHTPR